MIYSYSFPIISGQLPDYLLTRRVKAARSNCHIIAMYTADSVLNDDFCGFTTGNTANAQRLLVPRTLLLSFQWSDCICTWWTMETVTSYIHIYIWPCSTWHFCWVFNEASACAPDEPWKWQWMLLHLNTHRETAKNVSSLPEAPFVASCLQQIEQNIHIYIWPCSSDPVLLDTSAEVSMKRVHVHLMSHGNGTRCCCILTHTHRETAKNVSSLPEAPFIASCLQQIEQNIHIYIWPCSTWHFCSGFNDSSMIYSYPFLIISGQLPGYLLTRRVKAARSNCYIIAMYTADSVLNDDFCGFTAGNTANAQRLLVPRTLLLSFQWSDCICTWWTMETVTSYPYIHRTCSTGHFCWVFNEASACAPDEPWKWQWMLLHLNTHRETAKNVSSLPEAPFVASCLQQTEQNIHIYIWPCSSDPVLLDTSAEVSMKRVHVHLMSHGNGKRCCCIWTHTQRNSQKLEQSVRSTVGSIMFATNRTKYPYIHLTLFFWPCSTWHFCWSFNEASACAPAWAMEMAMVVAAFEHTQRNSRKREQSVRSTIRSIMLATNRTEWPAWSKPRKAEDVNTAKKRKAREQHMRRDSDVTT